MCFYQILRKGLLRVSKILTHGGYKDVKAYHSAIINEACIKMCLMHAKYCTAFYNLHRLSCILDVYSFMQLSISCMQMNYFAVYSYRVLSLDGLLETFS